MMKQQCAGILGWLFGHKFVKRAGGWVEFSNTCYRCGRTP